MTYFQFLFVFYLKALTSVTDRDTMQEFVTTVISVQLQNASEGPWSATHAGSLLLLVMPGFP